MSRSANEVVPTVFGVLYFGDEYEAEHGSIEFRGGRLVGVQIGRLQTRHNTDGLTVGFTELSDFEGEPPEPHGFIRSRAVNRVYVSGVLDTETDLGTVHITTDRL